MFSLSDYLDAIAREVSIDTIVQEKGSVQVSAAGGPI